MANRKPYKSNRFDGQLNQYELFRKFFDEQCLKEGWKLKMYDEDHLEADFYFTKPLTYIEKLLKRPPNEPVIIHAEMDHEDPNLPIRLSKGK